jgi:hypothetical protein
MGKLKIILLLAGLAVATFLFRLYSSELMAATDGAAAFHSGIDLISDLAGASAVQSTDLDRDGDMDVVSAGRESGLVIWHVNDGGAMPAFARYDLGYVQGAYDLAPVDLDRDGDIDVVVVGVGELNPASVDESMGATGTIVWFENNLRLGGGFTQHLVAESLPYSVALHAVDLDRDGDLDLLFAARDGNTITWYESSGVSPLTFFPRLISDQALGAVSVHSGDFDGDGDIDVISASENDNKIALYLNDGLRPPSFSEVVVYQPGPPPPNLDYAKGVYAADLDGDNDLDIAYVGEENNEVGWLENLGGSPPSFAHHLLSNIANHAKTVRAIDLDLDGDLDLLVASSGDNQVTWYENDGQRPPTFTVRLVTNSALGARGAAVADLDGDGDLDILSASRNDNRIAWYPNLTIHRTALYSAATQSIINVRKDTRGVHAGDLDRDGDMDLLSISETEVAWHENNGATPPGFTTYIIASDIRGGRWVSAGDLDGDGDLDLVAAAKHSNLVVWYENLGGQPLAFATHEVTREAKGARAALVIDVDLDGDLDLYSASDTDDSVYWYENLGGRPPAFVRHLVTNQADYVRSVYAGDLDGDGDIDFISASQADNKVAWYENLGANSRSFQAHVIDNRAAGVQHIHADDLDGDGDLDVVAALELDNSIRWYQNLGGSPPSFAMYYVSANTPAVHAVYTGDADQDGDIDIFAAIEASNTVAWFENVGGQPPTFVEHMIVNNTLIAHGVHAADVDGDGDLDVISASRDDGKIAWYENVGGQYAVTSELNPDNSALLQIIISHRGQPGDPPLEINYLELQLLDENGAPLDTELANLLIQRVNLYRIACCDRVWDPTSSPLLSTVAPLTLQADGRLVIPLLSGDPNSYVAAGASGALAILIEGATNSCQNGLHLFTFRHLVTASMVHNSATGLALLPEAIRPGDHGATPAVPERPVVMINEFLASNNNGLTDPDDPTEFPDWVELYNSASAPIDLSGKFLSDELTNPTRHRIADGVTIPAKGYLLFYADGEPEQGPMHLNFKLEKNGESIGFYEAGATGIRKLDEVVFGEQTINLSTGRYPNGSDTWEQLGVSTPGGPNVRFRSVGSVQLPFVYRGVACP